MVNTMLVTVLTMIAVLVSCSSPQHEPTGDVTCDAPSVERGDPGHVTCNFNVDVSTQKRPISVKVVLHKIDNIEVEVLECNFLQSLPVKCTLTEGYQFDEQIGEQLQVNITTASDEHVGRYVCSLMSNEMLPKSQPCNFRLKGSTWPTPAVTTQAEDKKDKGSTWPTPAVKTQAEEEKDKGSEQEGDVEKPWVIPVVVTSVVFIIGGVVVVVGVVLVRRYRRQGHNSDTRPQTIEDAEETQPDQERQQGGSYVMPIVNHTENRQKADISRRPVSRSSAGAREEGEDDERSPLMNRDADGPEDNTGTKREYNKDHPEDITRSAAQPTAMATGSDDNNTDHVDHPLTQVTSAPVETEPDDSVFSIQRESYEDTTPEPTKDEAEGGQSDDEDILSVRRHKETVADLDKNLRQIKSIAWPNLNEDDASSQRLRTSVSLHKLRYDEKEMTCVKIEDGMQ